MKADFFRPPGVPNSNLFPKVFGFSYSLDRSSLLTRLAKYVRLASFHVVGLNACASVFHAYMWWIWYGIGMLSAMHRNIDRWSTNHSSNICAIHGYVSHIVPISGQLACILWDLLPLAIVYDCGHSPLWHVFDVICGCFMGYAPTMLVKWPDYMLSTPTKGPIPPYPQSNL